MKLNRGFVPIIIGIVVIVAIVVGAIIYSTAKNKDGELVGNDRDSHGCIPSAGYSWCEAKQKCLRAWEEKCNSVATSTIPADWKTYHNERYGFEFKYPEILTVNTDDEKTTLSHSVQYPHPNPCDFRGDSKPLNKFTDFSLSFEVKKSSINKLTSYFSDYLKPYLAGNTTFQNYSMGVEGCGQSAYYLSFTPDTTLIITHPYVAEYNPVNNDYKTFLGLSGVFSPEKIDQTFQQILSTLKFTK